MAIGKDTFGNLGGAVSDLFGGLGTRKGARLKGEGIRLGAEGLRIKARGDIVEAENYERAAGLADRNAVYQAASTAIKGHQAQREIYSKIGGQTADIAAAGFGAGGTALDLLRDSAAQGALTRAVLAQQGAIAEEGYREQARSYRTMAETGRSTAGAEFGIADRTDALARQTEEATRRGATGSFIGAALKGAAALGSLFTTGNPLPAMSLIGDFGGSGLPREEA